MYETVLHFQFVTRIFNQSENTAPSSSWRAPQRGERCQRDSTRAKRTPVSFDPQRYRVCVVIASGGPITHINLRARARRHRSRASAAHSWKRITGYWNDGHDAEAACTHPLLTKIRTAVEHDEDAARNCDRESDAACARDMGCVLRHIRAKSSSDPSVHQNVRQPKGSRMNTGPAAKPSQIIRIENPARQPPVQPNVGATN